MTDPTTQRALHRRIPPVRPLSADTHWAQVLWTPEDSNDVMDRDDMFLNFPELVTI